MEDVLQTNEVQGVWTKHCFREIAGDKGVRIRSKGCYLIDVCDRLVVVFWGLIYLNPRVEEFVNRAVFTLQELPGYLPFIFPLHIFPTTELSIEGLVKILYGVLNTIQTSDSKSDSVSQFKLSWYPGPVTTRLLGDATPAGFIRKRILYQLNSSTAYAGWYMSIAYFNFVNLCQWQKTISHCVSDRTVDNGLIHYQWGHGFSLQVP